MLTIRGLKKGSSLILVIAMLLTCFMSIGTNAAAASASSISLATTYGNYETAGIDIKIDNMNGNETATIEYKKHSDADYKQGYPFTPYDTNHMATSLFNLASNTQYDVKITLSDPIDGVSGTNPYETTVTTKPEYTGILPTPLRIRTVYDQADLTAKLGDARPGDEFRLASGIYTNQVSLNGRSGTADHPIVFTSMGNSKPLFSNANFQLLHSNYITINNIEVHDETRNGILIRGCHDITISNCYIHDSIPVPPLGGDYTGDILIEHGDESDIPGRGAFLIINNILSDEVHDPYPINHGPIGSFRTTQGQCYDGIGFDYEPANGFTTIRGNTIYGVCDGVSLAGDEGTGFEIYDGPDSLQNKSYCDQNMDFYDNKIYACKDDAIQHDGHLVNSRVFRNILGNCQCSFSTAPYYGGPCFFIYNYVYGFNEQCLKATTSVPGGSKNVYVYNNTFIEKTRDDGTGWGCYCRYQTVLADNFIYKNNIFYAQGPVETGDMNGEPDVMHCYNFVYDYNCLFSTRSVYSTYLFRWLTWKGDPGNGSWCPDYESYRKVSGQESHGIYADPRVEIIPVKGLPPSQEKGMLSILKLSADSPCIDKGELIPGINDNYNGAAPDIGAYESDGTEDIAPTATPTNAPPSPLPTSTPVPVGSGTLVQNLGIYDKVNAANWSIQQNLQTGDQAFGDDTNQLIGTLPAYLAGAEWIRPANASKSYATNPLCTFTVTGNVNADVYVMFNTSVPKPSWLSAFIDTTDRMDVGGCVYNIFKEPFGETSIVALGANNNSGNTYLAAILPHKAATPTNTPTLPYTPVTITLQQGVDGYTGGKDTGDFMESTLSTDASKGAGAIAAIRLCDPKKMNSGWCSNALVYFDLSTSGIPAGAIIDSARLSVYENTPTFGTGNLQMYRVIDPDNKGMWVEGAGATEGSKGGAAWNRRDGTADTVTTAWTNTAGSTIYDSVDKSSPGILPFTLVQTWNTSSNLRDDVQAWLDGAAVNQGWYIRAESGCAAQGGFYSDQYNTAANRPKLMITYHLLTTPEPTPTGPTATPTNTPAPTASQAPTATPSTLPTPTATPMPGPTSTPTNTPTATPTSGPTCAPANTPTPGPITITLQQGTNGYTGTKQQGSLFEDPSNKGFYGAGANTTFRMKDPLLAATAGQDFNALLYFDLSSFNIPNNAIIDSAVLSLYENIGAGPGYASGTCDVYRMTDPDGKGMWVQGTGAAENTNGGAAWLRRNGTGTAITTSWTNTTGSTIMDSVTDKNNPSGTWNCTAPTVWNNSSDLKADVQAWVNGAVNQGWYIRCRSGSGMMAGFYTNVYATVANRPKLTITYHILASIDTPIPTPTPTNTPTSMPIDTPTNTPTDIPTSTPTDTPTNTPTDTPTSTPTDTPTNTPTDTPTSTPTTTPPIILGDINGDGRILSSDALMALQATSMKIVLTENQKLAADVTKDGKVSAADALKILQFVSGKITQF